MRDTFRALSDWAELVLTETGLSLSQWLALKHVADGRIRSVGDVDRVLGFSSGASTRLLDQLESRGLVRRIRSGVDRRKIKLDTSPLGDELAESGRSHLTCSWEKHFDLPLPEQEDLIRSLSRLQHQLVAAVDARVNGGQLGI